MKGKLLGVGLCIALLGVAARPGYAVTAVSSTFNLSVYVDSNTNTPANATGSYSDSQVGTLNPYSNGLFRFDASDGGFAGATTFANAQWTNAGAGTVHLQSVGWVVQSDTPSHVALNTSNTGLDIWTYTFKATGNGTFDMNYKVTGFDSTFGLWGPMIHWNGPGGGLDVSNPFNPTTSGSFSRTITAGQTYTIGIGADSNLSSGKTHTDGFFNADFDWKVTESSVPGPAALLSFVGGLLVHLRRRKR